MAQSQWQEYVVKECDEGDAGGEAKLGNVRAPQRAGQKLFLWWGRPEVFRSGWKRTWRNLRVCIKILADGRNSVAVPSRNTWWWDGTEEYKGNCAWSCHVMATWARRPPSCVICTDVRQGSASPPASACLDWFKWKHLQQCKPKPSLYLYWLWRNRRPKAWRHRWYCDRSQLKAGRSNGIKCLPWAFECTTIWWIFPVRALTPFSHTLYILGD